MYKVGKGGHSGAQSTSSLSAHPSSLLQDPGSLWQNPLPLPATMEAPAKKVALWPSAQGKGLYLFSLNAPPGWPSSTLSTSSQLPQNRFGWSSTNEHPGLISGSFFLGILRHLQPNFCDSRKRNQFGIRKCPKN